MHAIDTYAGAILTANRFDDESATISGALYTSEGSLITESVRSVPRLEAHLPNDPMSIPTGSPVIGKHNYDGYDSYIDEAIYGGHIYAGWGHNITETISTAWAASEVRPDVPLLMVPWGRLWVSALHRIRDAMRLAGWDNRRLLLTTGSAVLGTVHVPERLMQFDPLFHEDAEIPEAMNVIYDRMIHRSITPPSGREKRPAFLSRGHEHRRLHPHEVAIETVLAERGFRIIEGWDMSVQDQISLINSCTALVAFSGSSLHNSVFADRGTPIFEIMDERATLMREQVRPLQVPLCRLREQPLTQIEGFTGEVVRPLDDILVELQDLLGMGSAS